MTLPPVYILDDKYSIRVAMARLFRAGRCLSVMMSDMGKAMGPALQLASLGRPLNCTAERHITISITMLRQFGHATNEWRVGINWFSNSLVTVGVSMITEAPMKYLDV